MRPIKIRLLFTLIISMVLTILPMPHLVTGLRPLWTLLFVFYVQFYLPRYFNYFFIMLVGLCLDVLCYTIMGEHAFALLLVTLLTANKSRRFYCFSLGQQMLYIALFCATYQSIMVLLEAFLGYYVDVKIALGSALTSMLLWPSMKWLGDLYFSAPPQAQHYSRKII